MVNDTEKTLHHNTCSRSLEICALVLKACRTSFGAIDYLCIVAEVALHLQKEDNSYMSRLRDIDNQIVLVLTP